MRKYMACFFLFIILCFAIPILFAKSFPKAKQTDIAQNAEENIPPSTYDYKKYQTVRLYHAKTKKIETLSLDEYLYGVVSSEMPADFEEEALKAQAVVARTYTLYKIIHNSKKHENADICDSSSCCQAWISKEDRLAKWKEENRTAYWNNIVKAVNTTQGKMITYNNEPINAFFHSNSGGSTEAPIDVWGGSGYPYLKAVTTSGEDAYSQYSSNVTVTQTQFTDTIKKVHSDFKIDFSQKDCIKVEEYTDGNRVKTIKVGNLTLSGVEMRTLFGLRSANFEITMENKNIKFEVTGYGHGVGMSQTGADSLAKQGKNYEEIIHHFYTDVEIKDI